MKYKLIILLFSLILALMIAGCGNTAVKDSESTAEAAAGDEAAVAAPSPVPTPEPTPYASVTLSGDSEITLNAYDEEIAVTDSTCLSSLIKQAGSFTQLRKIDLGYTNADSSTLDQLRNTFPSCIITYSFKLGDVECRSNDPTVDISSLGDADLETICEGLKKLPSLSSVEMMKEDGSTDFSMESAAAIADMFPGATVNFTFDLFGQTVSISQERLEYVRVQIGNNGLDQFREIIPVMHNLEYLLLDSCYIDYDVLAQLRDDFPDIEVVWRINYSMNGLLNCLTDTETIWAESTTDIVTDAYTGDLKYCTKVKYIDLGHQGVHDISFVSYMPDLEVAIFALTYVTDLSPLANCPKLEYLEIFNTEQESPTDITPLAACTNLQYLNIGANPYISDLSCLYGLTNLKKLWCTMSYISQAQQDTIREMLPDCEFDFDWVEPDKGGWRYDENGQYTERYALLCQQFGTGYGIPYTG